MRLALFTLVACALLCCGCGATEQLARYAEAARDVAAVAEPCMVAAQEQAIERCGDDRACITKAYESSKPLADALDLMKQLWCAVSPTSDGCGK